MQLSEYVVVFLALSAGLHGPEICATHKISRATFNRVLAELRAVGCVLEYDPIKKVYIILNAGPFRPSPDLLTGISVLPNHRTPVSVFSSQGLPKLPGANAADGRAAQTVRRGGGSDDGESEGA